MAAPVADDVPHGRVALALQQHGPWGKHALHEEVLARLAVLQLRGAGDRDRPAGRPAKCIERGDGEPVGRARYQSGEHEGRVGGQRDAVHELRSQAVQHVGGSALHRWPGQSHAVGAVEQDLQVIGGMLDPEGPALRQLTVAFHPQETVQEQGVAQAEVEVTPVAAHGRVGVPGHAAVQAQRHGEGVRVAERIPAETVAFIAGEHVARQGVGDPDAVRDQVVDQEVLLRPRGHIEGLHRERPGTGDGVHGMYLLHVVQVVRGLGGRAVQDGRVGRGVQVPGQVTRLVGRGAGEVQVVHQGFLRLERGRRIGPVEHHPQFGRAGGNLDVMGGALSLVQAAGGPLVPIDGLPGPGPVQAPPAEAEIRPGVPQVVGGVQQKGLHEPAVGIASVQFAPTLVQHGQRAGHTGGRGAGSAARAIGVGRVGAGLAVPIGADVGLDPAIGGRAAAAAASQDVDVVQVGRGDHVLPLFVPAGDVAPEVARPEPAVGGAVVPGGEHLDDRRVVVDLVVHQLGGGGVAHVAAVAVAAAEDHGAFVLVQVHRVGHVAAVLADDEVGTWCHALLPGIQVAGSAQDAGHHVAMVPRQVARHIALLGASGEVDVRPHEAVIVHHGHHARTVQSG